MNLFHDDELLDIVQSLIKQRMKEFWSANFWNIWSKTFHIFTEADKKRKILKFLKVSYTYLFIQTNINQNEWVEQKSTSYQNAQRRDIQYCILLPLSWQKKTNNHNIHRSFISWGRIYYRMKEKIRISLLNCQNSSRSFAVNGLLDRRHSGSGEAAGVFELAQLSKCNDNAGRVAWGNLIKKRDRKWFSMKNLVEWKRSKYGWYSLRCEQVSIR